MFMEKQSAKEMTAAIRNTYWKYIYKQYYSYYESADVLLNHEKTKEQLFHAWRGDWKQSLELCKCLFPYWGYSNSIQAEYIRGLSHQVVIRSDPKQLPEVAEGHGGVGFKPEVWVVVGWGEVTAFAVWSNIKPKARVTKKDSRRDVCDTWKVVHSYQHTWGRRCFPQRRSPASARPSPAWSWGCPPCSRYPAGWPLAKQRRWSGGGGQKKEQHREVWAGSRRRRSWCQTGLKRPHDKRQRQTEGDIWRGEACLLVRRLPGGIDPPVADLFLMGRAHSERGRHLSERKTHMWRSNESIGSNERKNTNKQVKGRDEDTRDGRVWSSCSPLLAELYWQNLWTERNIPFQHFIFTSLLQVYSTTIFPHKADVCRESARSSNLL